MATVESRKAPEVPPEMKAEMETRFVRPLERYAQACDRTPCPTAESVVKAEAYRALARIIERHGVS